MNMVSVNDKTKESKIKVTKAQIIVEGTNDKPPYFSIQYRVLGENFDRNGFGSYNLDNVIMWKNELLEIVTEGSENNYGVN